MNPLRFPDLTGDLATDARAYCRSGFAILPLVPGRQNPLIPEWQHEATSDWGCWEAGWQEMPKANIGIHLGRSGLVVVDADSHEAREFLRTLYPDLPPMVWVCTPRGRHFYFRQPVGVEVRRQILHRKQPELGQKLGDADLEIRGGDLYVVAPPSEVDATPRKIGGCYEVGLVEIDFPLLPGECVQNGAKRPAPEKRPSERAERLREQTRRVQMLVPDHEVSQLARRVVEVKGETERHRLALAVGFRLARDGFTRELAIGQAEHIAGVIQRGHGEVERKSETFAEEVERAIAFAFSRVEEVREALTRTFLAALRDDCYGQGVRADRALAVHLALIGKGIEQASIEAVASYGQLRVATGRSGDNAVHAGLRCLEQRGLIERRIPRDREGRRRMRLANTYVLTTDGASELETSSDGREERSDAPFVVKDPNSTVGLVLGLLRSDAGVGCRPLVLTWAALCASEAPLLLDSIARIRGRSVLTTKRQIGDLTRSGLAVEVEPGCWATAAHDPEQILASFARMAVDAGAEGKAQARALRVRHEQRAFHGHGIDARAERRAMVERIKAKRVEERERG